MKQKYILCPCFEIVTSQRKKSECFFSDALFTNSLKGRVLWIKRCSWQICRESIVPCVCVDVFVRESSLVRKVFVQKVHLWHGGYVDLHLLVSTVLSKIFNRPLLEAGAERDASQHGRSALGNNHIKSLKWRSLDSALQILGEALSLLSMSAAKWGHTV